MRYAASAVLELKYLPLGTKISNLCTQKAALHEAIVLPALRPDLFQGIRTPPKVLRRAQSRFCFCFIYIYIVSGGIRLRRCSGALVASAAKVLRRAKSRFIFIFIFFAVHSPPTVLRRASRLGLTSTKVLAYCSTEVPAY